MWPCIVRNFFLIKPTDALISQIYFINKLYMFGAFPLPTIRSFPLYIRHWYMSCRFDDSCQVWPGGNCSSIDKSPVPSWSCMKAVMKPAWHMPVLNVQWKTPDFGQRKCPKHVEFLDKINLGKLVLLLVLLKRNFTVMFTYHYNVTFCCVKYDFIIFVLNSTSELLLQFLRKTADNIMMLFQTCKGT